MKVIMFENYGSPQVLKLKEIEKPYPKNNEILVKVKAVSVGYGDLLARSGMSLKNFNMPIILFPIMKIIFGIRKPRIKILGSEISGIVEEVGHKVTKFKKGDEIFAYVGQNLHGNAEFICIDENTTVSLKPNNMSFIEAGSTPYGAIMAYSIIQRLNLKVNQKLLIIGASGGIGHFAVQFAKLDEALVTGVCSTARIELVKSLGADKVIDYTKEDIENQLETYDVIIDILHKTTFRKIKRILSKNGKYILISFGMRNILHMYWRKVRGGKKVLCMMAKESNENLDKIKILIEQGKIVSRVDKVFPLEQASDAHSYIENGSKKGQVVLSLD